MRKVYDRQSDTKDGAGNIIETGDQKRSRMDADYGSRCPDYLDAMTTGHVMIVVGPPFEERGVLKVPVAEAGGLARGKVGISHYPLQNENGVWDPNLSVQAMRGSFNQEQFNDY